MAIELAEERKTMGKQLDGLRTCLVSGMRKPKDLMVRFVIDSEARPVPDLEEKLPGRGLWLSAERETVQKACMKNLFSRRARQKVNVDTELPYRVEELLAKRCVKWLELARRASKTGFGFDEVRRRLSTEHCGLLLSAHDSGVDGRGKLQRLVRELGVKNHRTAAMVTAMTAAEIGMAFGRERVAHACVARGGLCDSLVRDTARLGGLRSLRPNSYNEVD
ncbi:MAG: hypothetical protein CBB68_08670 [Rhodospirillaceae bacterium TMED8]|nr:hypothetical protein [Magnetovibrio sp.]OUT50440.1 MAG: hypothetical protein CBB68_08670 [Rhodospirillaceae bacterium TMED8]